MAPRKRRGMTLMARLRRVAIALVLLAAFAGIFVFFLMRTTPEWYQPPAPNDPDIADLAATVEYRIVEELQRVRDTTNPEPWTLRVREEQVNAWLVARLPEWLAHEHGEAWPDELHAPQIHLHPNGIHLAVGLAATNDDADNNNNTDTNVDDLQILGLIVSPQLDDDGLLRLTAESVTVGRLNLPTGPMKKLRTVLDGLVEREVLASEDAQWVVDFLSGEIPIDPEMDLADDRRVRLRAINAPAVGVLDITLETLAPEDKTDADDNPSAEN